MSRKLLCVIISIVFVVGMSAGAYAASNPEIRAILNYGIKIEVNGAEFVPTDTDGSRLVPITYNGRTYLPVRSLANALDVAVDFENNTVYLGERGKTPLTGKDFMKNYTCQFTTDQSLLMVNDVQYKSGIVYTGTDGYYEYSGFVYPNGKYQKFGGVACMEDNDGSTEEVIIKIRENDYQGEVLKEITLESGESIPFEIDIPGVKTLYFQNLVSDRTPKSTNPDIMMIAEPYFQ
jgi:hypothetical protein